MAEAKIQKRNTYTIYDDEGIGTVQIADEVVAIIAGLAASHRNSRLFPIPLVGCSPQTAY